MADDLPAPLSVEPTTKDKIGTDDEATFTEAQRALRDVVAPDGWPKLWGEFSRAYNEYRDLNPGWRAFWTDHHQHALEAALLVVAELVDLPARDARVRAQVAEEIRAFGRRIREQSQQTSTSTGIAFSLVFDEVADMVEGDTFPTPPPSTPTAINGCDDCSVEPGEPHRYVGCPGARQHATEPVGDEQAAEQDRTEGEGDG